MRRRTSFPDQLQMGTSGTIFEWSLGDLIVHAFVGRFVVIE